MRASSDIRIHPTAIVSEKSVLAADVSIGPFSIIHDHVELGAGTVVEGHCELGYPTPLAQNAPLVIGPDSHIRSHSVFYAGSQFGRNLKTGHRVTVREKLTAGRDLSIGTLCDLQGHGQIGDFVRLHSNVHIGQATTIGNFVWIYPYVVLTNDPQPPSSILQGPIIEDYAVISTKAVVLPGVRIGHDALIGAMALVTKDVPAETVAFGVPSKLIAPISSIARRDGTGPAYPWFPHLQERYPPEIVAAYFSERHRRHGRKE